MRSAPLPLALLVLALAPSRTALAGDAEPGGPHTSTVTAAALPEQPLWRRVSPRVKDAQDARVTAQTELPQQQRWYGWQTLGADLAVIGLGAAAASAESEGAGITALMIYALASPAIHIAHGNGGRAAGSLGMRIGIPAVAGMIGSSIACGSNGCNGDLGGIGKAIGFGGGAIVGGLIASGLDAAFLGWEDVDPTQPAIAPAVGRTPEGVTTWGFAGTF